MQGKLMSEEKKKVLKGKFLDQKGKFKIPEDFESLLSYNPFLLEIYRSGATIVTKSTENGLTIELLNPIVEFKIDGVTHYVELLNWEEQQNDK